MERSNARGMRAGLVDLSRRWPLSDGEQVNANLYQKLFRQHVVPWVQIFAPVHTARTTQQFLAEFFFFSLIFLFL
jgi:hypothetical protein